MSLTKNENGNGVLIENDDIDIDNKLMHNLDKIHTTELGVERIRKNLNLDTDDVVAWCKDSIKNADNIFKKGKNWYAQTKDCIITINAHSFTIITAHKKK